MSSPCKYKDDDETRRRQLYNLMKALKILRPKIDAAKNAKEHKAAIMEYMKGVKCHPVTEDSKEFFVEYVITLLQILENKNQDETLRIQAAEEYSRVTRNARDDVDVLKEPVVKVKIAGIKYFEYKQKLWTKGRI